eukprot:5825990-Ditylum_brightwellii.AAC.1
MGGKKQPEGFHGSQMAKSSGQLEFIAQDLLLCTLDGSIRKCDIDSLKMGSWLNDKAVNITIKKLKMLESRYSTKL